MFLGLYYEDHDGEDPQGIVTPETTNKQELGILVAGGPQVKEGASNNKNLKQIAVPLVSRPFRTHPKSHYYVDLQLWCPLGIWIAV